MLYLYVPRLPMFQIMGNCSNKEDIIVSDIKKKADEGDAESQFTMAEMNMNGYVPQDKTNEGVEKNESAAILYYEKASMKGHQKAKIKLDNIIRLKKENLLKNRQLIKERTRINLELELKEKDQKKTLADIRMLGQSAKNLFD